MLLLELNRLLRPGGYFIWSATPIYQDLPVDVEIWKGNGLIMTFFCVWDFLKVHLIINTIENLTHLPIMLKHVFLFIQLGIDL